MPEKFIGLVKIENSAAEPKVRITLSGDAGTAQFVGTTNDSPSTMISDNRIHIGQKPRDLTNQSKSPGLLDGLPGQGPVITPPADSFQLSQPTMTQRFFCT